MNFFFIILTFLISAFIARILIPRILLISLRKKLFDIPDNRKIHKRAIPRLGGVSFFPTTLFSFCLVYAFRLLGGDSVSTVYASYLLPELLLFACGMTLLYLTGYRRRPCRCPLSPEICYPNLLCLPFPFSGNLDKRFIRLVRYTRAIGLYRYALHRSDYSIHYQCHQSDRRD